MIPFQILSEDDGRHIAYHCLAPQDGARENASVSPPSLMFLGGLRSDMTGTKAVFLEQYAQKRGWGFVRFDYTGHGESSGAFEETTIADWARDAVTVLDRLTTGPQILIGSSMGGWAALLTARARPERIAGIVGVAAAPDFTEDLTWPSLTPDQQGALMRDGQVAIPSEYDPDDPMVFTRALIEAGRDNLVLRSPLRLPFPVRLVHGDADPDAPHTVALRLLAHMECPDARLTVIKGAGHRLSEPAELNAIAAAVEEIVAATRAVDPD